MDEQIENEIEEAVVGSKYVKENRHEASVVAMVVDECGNDEAIINSPTVDDCEKFKLAVSSHTLDEHDVDEAVISKICPEPLHDVHEKENDDTEIGSLIVNERENDKAAISSQAKDHVDEQGFDEVAISNTFCGSLMRTKMTKQLSVHPPSKRLFGYLPLRNIAITK